MSDRAPQKTMLEPEVRAGTVASPEECERIALWNRTQADYPRNLCVHQLIELQARENPSKVAVEFQGQQLSYEEVSRRSNRLAHLLRKKGVKADVLVGLCVDRSAEMLIALLGILKAGGAYVPLDPAYPADRIQYVLSDANAKVLITESRLLPSLPKLSADIVCLDRVSLDQESSQECQTEVKPENLAYVIYTSGSTGKPKGVQLEHRSVINFLCSMQKEPGLSSSDILVAVTTLSFDIAGLEMYLPLISGARVVIASREATYDARLLSQILDRSGATVMQATPATWRLLFESGWKGDRKLKVLVGGEALPAELAQQLVAHCGPVWNMYGPTETTIWSSVYRVRGDEERILPIGRPIANTTLYILDENRLPVCIGKEGELYIGGEGLARGYFGRPELTAEKFLDDPFRHGERMYRTGDLARFREDGNVEFLGRMDHQVKIRGFRIELGEIEAVLEQHPAIRRAVVIAREDAAGEKKLAAYVVSHPDQVVTSGSLREHVREQLPDYMIPAAFVQLAVLPLTPNGKVDRKALPAPASGDFESSHEYVAPRDPIELKLARIWEETLAMRPVGVKTSFFDLGGRSVLAARMFMKISREFGKDLPLSLLFQAPTIEQLATELRTQGQKSTSYSTLVEIQPRGSRPPFFCVHGGAGSTLFLHRLSREMASDQPFYGFEPEGMDGRRFQRTTVEQMAKHYIAEMRKIQPQGPYLIGGYCFGGLVAFEMAQQLRKQGQPPALIAMFSAPLRFHRVARRAKAPAGTMASSSRWARFLRSPGQAICWRFVSGTRRFRSWMHMTVCRAFLRLGMRVPQTLRTMYVVRMIHQAEQSYEPSFYDGTLTLFRGKGLYEDDPDMGWDGLAKRLENFEIGDGGLRSRRDIMNEPLVGLLAKELAVCFERATGKQFPNVDGCEENARGATAVPAAGPR